MNISTETLSYFDYDNLELELELETPLCRSVRGFNLQEE